MRILCAGISFKTAGVALRERVAVNPAGLGAVLSQLTAEWAHPEFVVLSTCNRTEVYTARPVHAHPREEELRNWLCALGGDPTEPLREATYMLTDAGAIRHLFAVVCGLDSLVVGEGQITGQVKAAYAAARDAQTARAILNELFQTALHVTKHVRSETGIGAGKVSVASAAVDCVMRSLDSPAGKCVLSIGAGKMNQLMLRRLTELGTERILIANRSPQRAGELSRLVGGEAVDFDSLPEHLCTADIVLTSTGSRTPIITREMIDRAQQRRGGRRMLIVDIAVPRDVAPDARDVRNVVLYNIDELEQIIASSVTDRQKERVAAETVLAGHVTKVLRRLKIHDVAPTIEAIYRYARRIADEEFAAATNKLSGHSDTDTGRDILRRALHRTVSRILHPAVENLRKTATGNSARAHVAALRKLFGLDDEGGASGND